MREFFDAFRLQCRVVGALILREVVARYGRENLGFAWVFAEPLIFVFPVLTMWHYLRPRYAYGGVLWADISWSGYLPLMLYRHLGGAALYAIRTSSTVLYHRFVTSTDIIAAKMVVEIVSNFGTALFSLFVLMAIGEMQGPRDWSMFYIGYFYMAWWCAAVALVVGGLSERSVWTEKIWAPVGYM